MAAPRAWILHKIIVINSITPNGEKGIFYNVQTQISLQSPGAVNGSTQAQPMAGLKRL